MRLNPIYLGQDFYRLAPTATTLNWGGGRIHPSLHPKSPVAELAQPVIGKQKSFSQKSKLDAVTELSLHNKCFIKH